jgi:hypothetical protein
MNDYSKVNWIKASGKNSSLITCIIAKYECPTEENFKTQYHKRELNVEPPNTTQKYTRPG